MGRSQLHKERVQGVRSDGSQQLVVLANALVDQTSSTGVADSYQFAANSFTTSQGGLRYEAQSVVSGVPKPLLSGFTFTESTRTLNWTKTTATYVIRITAYNEMGVSVSDDFDIVVS